MSSEIRGTAFCPQNWRQQIHLLSFIRNLRARLLGAKSAREMFLSCSLWAASKIAICDRRVLVSASSPHRLIERPGRSASSWLISPGNAPCLLLPCACASVGPHHQTENMV